MSPLKVWTGYTSIYLFSLTDVLFQPVSHSQSQDWLLSLYVNFISISSTSIRNIIPGNFMFVGYTVVLVMEDGQLDSLAEVNNLLTAMTNDTTSIYLQI